MVETLKVFLSEKDLLKLSPSAAVDPADPAIELRLRELPLQERQLKSKQLESK